jgi:dihydrofolate synthase/folylpolyglutamate synthase
LNQVSCGHLRVLLSVSSDKDAEAILRPLIDCAETIWLTRAEPIRSQDPEILATLCRDIAPRAEIRVVSDPERAVRMARDGLESDDLLCCAGSVYLAGIARRVLGADRRPLESS